MLKNIAVIGCGYWGQNLVRNFHELGALAAVVDDHPVNRASMTQKYGVPALGFDEVLAHTDIQAVVIATPAASHADIACKAMLAGKDVFVEKPIALTLVDATRMIETAKQYNRILMVGHLLQYHPVFMHLLGMVRAGALGTFRTIYSSRLSLGKIRLEENVFWSFAPHDISMILGLTGTMPTAVTSYNAGVLAGNNLPSNTHAHMAFGPDMHAHISVSWLHPFKEQKLVVIGDAAMAVFDDTQPWANKLAIYAHNVSFDTNGHPVIAKAEPTYPVIPQSEPLKGECQHFLDCIETRAQPRTDGAEGLRVLTVLHAADNAGAST